MSLQLMIAGITLGLVSSLHCVGMCGPLSLALPVQYFFKTQRIAAILLYQVGRVISYSTLGFILGFAGRRIYLAGYQRWFSVALGLTMLFLLIHYWILRKRLQPNFLNSFYLTIQGLMTRILKTRGIFPFLFFGIANGFLPCGMVYLALAGALVTTQITQSVLFMVMFGVGTIPAMIAISFLGQFFTLKLRNSFRRIIPVFISIMAVLLILRGMNLGIPFVSPLLQPANSAPVSCH